MTMHGGSLEMKQLGSSNELHSLFRVWRVPGCHLAGADFFLAVASLFAAGDCLPAHCSGRIALLPTPACRADGVPG